MDYGKLTKPQLIAELDERGIAYSSSWDKDRLIDLLINEENKSKQTQQVIVQSGGGFGKIGAIINIVFASIAAVIMAFYVIVFVIAMFYAFSMIIFVIIFGLLLWGAIATIQANVKYKNGEGSKKKAGVLAIFFGGLIGAIIVLASEDINEEK